MTTPSPHVNGAVEVRESQESPMAGSLSPPAALPGQPSVQAGTPIELATREQLIAEVKRLHLLCAQLETTCRVHLMLGMGAAGR